MKASFKQQKIPPIPPLFYESKFVTNFKKIRSSLILILQYRLFNKQQQQTPFAYSMFNRQLFIHFKFLSRLNCKRNSKPKSEQSTQSW